MSTISRGLAVGSVAGRLLWVVSLLLGLSIISTLGPSVDGGAIKVGAVLSTVGRSKEMEQARMGYELFADVANKRNNGKGVKLKGKDGAEVFLTFNFTWLDDNDNETQHEHGVKQLLDNDKVHFLFGSHPRFAHEEGKLAQDRGRMNYHCCVGLETLYAQGFENVFGIQVNNKQYTRLSIRSMGLKGLKRLAVVYYEPNDFTRTTCRAAVQFAKELKESIGDDLLGVVLEDTYDDMNLTTLREWFSSFADRAKELEVDGVVACSQIDDGKLLLDAFHKLR